MNAMTAFYVPMFTLAMVAIGLLLTAREFGRGEPHRQARLQKIDVTLNSDPLLRRK